jgi:hypothetical protein
LKLTHQDLGGGAISRKMRKSEDNEADIPSGRHETGPHVKLFTKIEFSLALTAGGSYGASHQGSLRCFSNCDPEHARLLHDLPYSLF